MPFRDRSDAGRKLAEVLIKYRGQNVVVLALPRGGVPVAKEVAAALGAPLDLLLVRKIGVPAQPELAMGAVVNGPRPLTVRNEDVIRLAGVTEAEFAAIRDRELVEIRRQRAVYLGERPRLDLADRVVIVIDDGVATGASMRAALLAARGQEPRKLVVAVPVASARAVSELRRIADEVICLDIRTSFEAIGFYYADFAQVSDQQVADVLAGFQPTRIADLSAR